MIFKVISLFLVFMAVLALFGRLRFPKLPGMGGLQRKLSKGSCPKCGRPQLGRGPCECERKS